MESTPPVVDIRQLRVHPELLSQLPEIVMRVYGILPLAVVDGPDFRLMLGMIDPTDQRAQDEVRVLTGFNIYPVRIALYGGPIPAWEDVVGHGPAENSPGDSSPELRRALERLFSVQGDDGLQ